MTKSNKPGSRKPENKSPNTAETKKSAEQQPQSATESSVTKGKSTTKANRPRIGGTAVQGAKSMQPREVKATSPSQQQAESYNRDMRRRMQHLGTGPYSEDPIAAAQEKRKKRIERRKKRVEGRREEAKRSIGPGFRATLGNRNTYFLIAIAAIIVIIIVVAIIVNHPFK
jgi:hypothetical protein